LHLAFFEDDVDGDGGVDDGAVDDSAPICLLLPQASQLQAAGRPYPATNH
jgi:hypothetical protein